MGLDEPKMTKREWKKSKKTGNGGMKDRRNIEAFPKEETDFVSEAIHLSVHESKGAWEGTYVYDHKQPEAEETTFTEGEGDEIEFFTEQASPLSVKPPSLMTPRQRRVVKKFNNPINLTKVSTLTSYFVSALKFSAQRKIRKHAKTSSRNSSLPSKKTSIS
jgi:hypothetical protein